MADHLTVTNLKRRPRMGAWIEIWIKLLLLPSGQRRPRMGAWIEMAMAPT